MKQEINEYEANRIKNSSERNFALCVIQAGLTLHRGPSIHCNPPVRNKGNRPVKTVTNPDFEVTNSENGLSVCVEVTNGNVFSSHKRAQLRVANRAGINNYVQISGEEVRRLTQASDPDLRLFLLFTLLGW